MYKIKLMTRTPIPIRIQTQLQMRNRPSLTQFRVVRCFFLINLIAALDAAAVLEVLSFASLVSEELGE